jgi:poly(3-hydroxybutyrate) depolymerase
MTVEGENDDITGCGQTSAALKLTPNLLADKKEHYIQAGVGHYGVFNGSRFRNEITPRIKAFMTRHAAASPFRSHSLPGVILLEHERALRARRAGAIASG